MKNLFLTLEGIEGVGKSTLLEFIKDFLTEQGVEFIVTREPGGTKVAEAIRQVILEVHDEPFSPETELLLLFAGRIQHVQQVILPALKAKKWVICDRFVDSTYAYQGGGRGMSFAKIAELEHWALGGLEPDTTFLLDAPIEVGFERIKNRNMKDRIEKEDSDFFENVRQTFLLRAKEFPQRFKVLQAFKPMDEVQAQALTILQTLVGQ